MKSFIKLLNWEVKRFSKLYGALVIMLILSQCIGVWLGSHSYLSRFQDWQARSGGTAAEYAARFEQLRMNNMVNSLWFEGAMSLCAISLVLYVFMIWYKEWVGRNTFAYRLLMLPTTRMNVYAAKLSAILLFVFGLVAFQVLLLSLLMAIVQGMVAADLRESLTIAELIRSNPMLNLFIPPSFIQFFLYYGAGVMAVIVAFTAILLERSYRYKGIAAGILYGVAALLVIISPYLISELSGRWWSFPLYPSEQIGLQVVMGLGIAAISIKLSAILLQKKVTV